MAQRLEVAVGSPFGINAGLRVSALVVDVRAYVGGGFGFGGGADVLIPIPLSDVYLGAGGFYGTSNVLSFFNTGAFGVRGVFGTKVDLGLMGYVSPVDLYFELHPMVFFPSSGVQFGVGGAIGGVLKFP